MIDCKTIADRVMCRLEIQPDYFWGKDRKRKTTYARNVAMALCYELTPASYPRLGKMFKRDHSTIIYAIRHLSYMTDKNHIRLMSSLRHELEWQDQYSRIPNVNAMRDDKIVVRRREGARAPLATEREERVAA